MLTSEHHDGYSITSSPSSRQSQFYPLPKLLLSKPPILSSSVIPSRLMTQVHCRQSSYSHREIARATAFFELFLDFIW